MRCETNQEVREMTLYRAHRATIDSFNDRRMLVGIALSARQSCQERKLAGFVMVMAPSRKTSISKPEIQG
ncbi:hypothetical protein RRG08_037144 [Elysia crispata]|uniref:Uncharacterized protein n=1 Tax=Elysia crispata TaxID=231223 RepID=A0AAE1DST4_9GAST|nr:hypothetical protein RRG08_037144 [Elysia crispata]